MHYITLCTIYCDIDAFFFALQTALEESKGREILKLQESLKEMQMKVDEIDALLREEREKCKDSN